MEIIQIECPKCYGRLHVDETTEKCFCMYCRTEVVLRETAKHESVTLTSLVKRGFLSLEYSDWLKAMEAFDQAANIDPEHAMIYVGKLLVELKLTKERLLGAYSTELTGYVNFQKALRFANSELKNRLEGYNNMIIKRLDEAKEQYRLVIAKEDEIMDKVLPIVCVLLVLLPLIFVILASIL